MTTFTDSHCHLNLHAFADDLHEVLKRASENGIDRIMLPGTDLPSSEQGVSIAEQHTSCYAAVGIHPNDANQWTETSYANLRALATNHPKVRAIGEIGLDYYRDWSAPDQQITILHQQLALAEELVLPVIIHIREALEDCFSILFEWQTRLEDANHPLAQYPGVLHAFPGSADDAMQGIEHHFMIGIGGPVTFKNALDRHSVVRALPLESILLETDAPFLTPHPHRGKRNEPAYIPLIAEKIAELKEISIDEVSHITSENARKLFQW